MLLIIHVSSYSMNFSQVTGLYCSLTVQTHQSSASLSICEMCWSKCCLWHNPRACQMIFALYSSSIWNLGKKPLINTPLVVLWLILLAVKKKTQPNRHLPSSLWESVDTFLHFYYPETCIPLQPFFYPWLILLINPYPYDNMAIFFYFTSPNFFHAI